MIEGDIEEDTTRPITGNKTALRLRLTLAVERLVVEHAVRSAITATAELLVGSVTRKFTRSSEATNKTNLH